MKFRRFGRTDWQVSEIGYGMWGMVSWSGSDDVESMRSLQRSVDLGINFFDTAFAYGNGRSEALLGRLVKENTDRRLYTATKVPPKNLQWPALAEYRLEDCYPPDHIEVSVNKSLENTGLDRFDLVQLHTWNDEWTDQPGWFEKLDELKDRGLFDAIGISINRWEPWNGLRAVRSGKIDAVQVIYNIFDQNPEDELFPACRENDVAVIARVPFDEGTLTGNLTMSTTFPEDDWRHTYFSPENLSQSVARADALRPIVPEGSTMAEMALRFILDEPTVSTVIPGMRKIANVESNVSASVAGPLTPELHQQLQTHRWVRKPAPWSD